MRRGSSLILNFKFINRHFLIFNTCPYNIFGNDCIMSFKIFIRTYLKILKKIFSLKMDLEMQIIFKKKHLDKSIRNMLLTFFSRFLTFISGILALDGHFYLLVVYLCLVYMFGLYKKAIYRTV